MNFPQIPYLGYTEFCLRIQDTIYTNVGMIVESVTNCNDSYQIDIGCDVLRSIRKHALETTSPVTRDPVWDNLMSTLDLEREKKKLGS